MTVRVHWRKERGYFELEIRAVAPDGTAIFERKRSPVQGSKTEAKRWGLERERYLSLHGDKPIKEVPTLRDFAETWLDNARANKLKPSTLDTYENIRLKLHVLPTLGDLRLDKIDDAAVQRLKSRMKELNPKTVNDALGVLSGILRLAEERNEVVKALRIKPLKRERTSKLRLYEFEDWERLVEGATKASKNHLVFVLLGGEAGLRRGEIVALEWPDIDFRREQITINRSDWEGEVGLPKGGQIRVVPMTARLSAALQAIRHLRGPRVFFQSNGNRVIKETLQSWMEGALKRAGMPEGRDIHILRHTFCSHLAIRGVPVNAIKELAGHADLATTMRYMHLSPAHKVEAIKALEKHTKDTPEAPARGKP